MNTTDPTPYTPTDDPVVLTDEQMEEEYLTTWTPGTQDEGRDRWRAWLTARDARVRAEALRDAAQAFNVEAVYFSSHDRSLSQGQQAAVVDVLAESLNWLHARAAYIEQETQPRASCGCDLTGMTPPAVHIVDRHGETQP